MTSDRYGINNLILIIVGFFISNNLLLSFIVINNSLLLLNKSNYQLYNNKPKFLNIKIYYFVSQALTDFAIDVTGLRLFRQ